MTDPLLICENLEKKRSSGFTLGPLSFSITGGEIIGLVGTNGAGKTTLLKLLMGLIRPSKGKVSYGFSHHRHRIGYVPEEIHMYDWMRVSELLGFVSEFYPDWDWNFCEQLLRTLVLDKDKRFCELSQGMKVKLALICALAFHPLLLLLDEPMKGLDPLIKRTFSEVISEYVRESHCAVIFSSHMLDEVAAVATRILLLKAGRLCQDVPVDVVHCQSSITDWFYRHHEQVSGNFLDRAEK